MRVSCVFMPWHRREGPAPEFVSMVSQIKAAGDSVSVFDINNEIFLRQFSKRVYWKYLSSGAPDEIEDAFYAESEKSFEEYCGKIIAASPDVIVFKLLSNNRRSSYRLAQMLKRRSGTVIVFSGENASREQFGWQADAPADFIIFGQDEVALPRLLDALRKGAMAEFDRDFTRTGKAIDCIDGPVFASLDELPLFDFSDFDFNQYRDTRRVEIFASRGCPWRCTFCGSCLEQGKFRTMSAQRIFREMARQRKTYPDMKFFRFSDNTINGDVRVLEELCGLLAEGYERGLAEIEWSGDAMIRPEMTPELLSKMSRAGCAGIGYGLESGSARVLKDMGKGFSVETAEKVIRATREASIKTALNIMPGFPTESREDFEETLRFIERNKAHITEIRMAFNGCRLCEQTAVYKHAAKFGVSRLAMDEWVSDGGNNTYEERVRRTEEVCRLTVALGIQLTFNGRVKRGKDAVKNTGLLPRKQTPVDVPGVGPVDVAAAGGENKDPVAREAASLRPIQGAGKETGRMERIVRFTWNMLYDCNYRCSYCFFEGKWDEYRKRTAYLSPDEWLGYWKRISDAYGKPYVVITGGEPFIYPNFIDIIKNLSGICHHINISSNSSGDLKRFAEEITPGPVSLSLSFQPQFDPLEVFLERLKFVRAHGFDGCINLVAYPPFLPQIAGWKEAFAAIGESPKIIPFFGTYRGVPYPQGYTEEEKKAFEITGDWMNTIRKRGALCSAGQTAALVFPDGKVARCGQIGEKDLIGNFFDSGFALSDGPAPCEAEFCPCDEGKTPGEEKTMAKETGRAGEAAPRPALTPQTVKKDMYFTWDIHYKCNFRCPYCWFYHGWVEGAKRSLVLSPEEWFTHWKRIYDAYGQIHIEITGGEPFMYPRFIQIIKLISAIHTVKITTNMSGDIETFVKEIDPSRVFLDLNFHPLFIDIDTHIRKTRMLKDAGFSAGVCYLAYPPQMKQMDYFRKRFEEAGISFALAAFWGEYEGKRYPESYTKEEMELIRPFLGDIDRIVYHLGGSSPKGRLCKAGHKYAVVQADGNIVRCGQLADTFIGSILREDFRLADHPMPCNAEVCPCNEYINIVDEEQCGCGQKEGDKKDGALPEPACTTPSAEEKIKRELEAVKFPRRDFPYRVHWHWEIGRRCNYACSYCPVWKNGAAEELSVIDPLKWKTIWDGLFEKYGPGFIRFSGGEPTIYPRFFDLVSLLLEKHSVNITTNLSFDVREFAEKIKPGGISIAASFHPEFAKIEPFLDKMRFLRERGYQPTISYVAYPPHLKDIRDFKAYAERRDIMFKIIPFAGEWCGRKYPQDYTPEEKCLIEELSRDSANEHQNETNKRFYDWHVAGEKAEVKTAKLCRMGQMYAKIHADGRVTRCCAGAKDGYRGSLLGQISDPGLRLSDEPVSCEIQECPCFKSMLVGFEEERWQPLWKMDEHPVYKNEYLARFIGAGK